MKKIVTVLCVLGIGMAAHAADADIKVAAKEDGARKLTKHAEKARPKAHAHHGEKMRGEVYSPDVVSGQGNIRINDSTQSMGYNSSRKRD